MFWPSVDNDGQADVNPEIFGPGFSPQPILEDFVINAIWHLKLARKCEQRCDWWKQLSLLCKPFQFQCEQKDITADHENWIEQHNKQDSYLMQRFYSHLLINK